tara:strand:+ start:751 stop:1476 length:726 start_codon:yes stop_codon:yes gene_type:complete
MKKISIVIPILNEGDNIKILINKILKNLRKLKKNFIIEIIFIDDNSTDNTREIFKNLKKKNIRYYIRKKKPDLSQSCILGFNKAKYENIIVMDGDLQHDPKYIPKMINLFFSKNLDFVICCRNFSKLLRKTKRLYLILRTVLSLLINRIFNLLVLKDVKDPMSGYFMFKKAIYKKNRKHLFAKGYKILADLLTSNIKNFKVYNLFTEFGERKKNESKLNLKVLVLIVLLILKRNNLFFKNS